MEKPQATPFTQRISVLYDLSCRLNGPDKDKVRETVNQTLETALVDHQNENGKEKNRRDHFRQNPDATRRRNTPAKGMLDLQALAQVVELNEEEELRSLRSKQMTLPPQACLDRYSLEVLVQSFPNTLSAIVATMMVQHDYLQREAHEAFEIVTQHSASHKGENKFYEKSADIKADLKKRFATSAFFKLSPSGKSIQTVAISEQEAETNYRFLELCARLLGEPFFSTPFNPSKPIPELMSKGHNFDEENALEQCRIRAVVIPCSVKNLIESLGYEDMKKKAKGPVLNRVITGNGHGGNHGTPPFEESEANKQSEINKIIDEYVARVEFRRRLKHPELEVVVDGKLMSKPFAAISNTLRHFPLSAIAKYVQVFAIQNGRRVLVSNLALPQTQISRGIAWHSELELEGRQKVSLIVEPSMDETGNLTGASLVVRYQTRTTWFEALVEILKRLRERCDQLWPAWATVAIVACIIGLLQLAPFFTINIFSFRALLTLVLSVTAFLFAFGWLKPAWRFIWPQQVAVHGFVAVMLIVMLLLGILPIASSDGTAVVTTTASASAEASAGAHLDCVAFVFNHGMGLDQKLDDMWLVSPEGLIVSLPAANAGSPDNASGKHSPVSSMAQALVPDANSIRDSANFLHFYQHLWDSSSRAVSPDGKATARLGTRNGQTFHPSKPNRNEHTKTVARLPAEEIVLHEVFHVEVLVDTAQMITLIRHASPTSVPINENRDRSSGTIQVIAPAGNLATGDRPSRLSTETHVSVVEAPKPNPGSAMVVSAPETPALVVFESPTGLGRLSKGDVLNANFKSIAVSANDPRGDGLVCTATGVVQDIRRTTGTDVEIRVGLIVTWSSGGNMVNSELQLLLTDCSKKIENSHFGVLAPPPAIADSVAQNDVALPKRLKQR